LEGLGRFPLCKTAFLNKEDCCTRGKLAATHLAILVKNHCFKSLSSAAVSFTTNWALPLIKLSYCFTTCDRAVAYSGSAADLALPTSCWTLAAMVRVR
jgi:hypothetical protein